MTRTLSVLLVALWVSACGRDPVNSQWERALLDADRAIDHHHLDVARTALGDLAEAAPSDADARYVALRLGVVDELAGRTADALTRYRTLWSSGIRDPIAATSLKRSAAIWYWKLNRQDRGLEIWRRLMILMPASAASTDALDQILDHFERHHDVAGALGFLTSHYRLLHRTEIGDNIIYERARLLDRGDHLKEAAESYALVIDHHPLSGLRDDAMWHLANLEIRRGNTRRALLLLRLLTEDRDDSWYLGTYDSAYADDARFMRGMIFLDTLHAPRRARGEFEAFLEEFPESILRDDARWDAIECLLQAGDGDAALEACDALKEAEPKSRYVKRCTELRTAIEGGASPRSLRTPLVGP